MNSVVLYFVSHLVHLLPDTRCWGIKRSLFRLSGIKVEKGVKICSSARIVGTGPVSISRHSWIGHNTIIVASAPVRIGQYVNIAPKVYIGTGTHDIDVNGISIAGNGRSLPITIGDGSWICANSTIIAGVSIGKRSIIAAGAVVISNVPDGELWGGVPAKKIKTLIE